MQAGATDSLIEEIIIATYGTAVTQRQRHALGQVLFSLVRLARVEQRLDVQRDVERAAGALASSSSRRETRAILRKIGLDATQAQRSLEFGQRDGAAPGQAQAAQPCPGPDCSDRTPRN